MLLHRTWTWPLTDSKTYLGIQVYRYTVMQEVRRGESSPMGASCAHLNLPFSRFPLFSKEYCQCFVKTHRLTLNIECVLVTLTHYADKHVEVNIGWRMQNHVCTKRPEHVRVICQMFSISVV